MAAMQSPEHTLPPLAPPPSTEHAAAIRRPAVWHLLLLSLLACAALTTVSVQQARLSAELAATPQSDSLAVDQAQPARQAMRLIEQSRGLEALHLLQRTEVRKHALDAQLRQNRRELDALLARSAAQTSDASASAVIVLLRADAAEYAALQDQLLGLSRQALTEPAAAGRAQQVLTGPSHAMYERLHESLDRWWTLSESQARMQHWFKQRQDAEAAKGWWALALAAAMAAIVALALRLLSDGKLTRQVRVWSATATLPEALEPVAPILPSPTEPQPDAAVTNPRVLAVRAAVTAWRHDHIAALPSASLTP